MPLKWIKGMSIIERHRCGEPRVLEIRFVGIGKGVSGYINRALLLRSEYRCDKRV